MTRMHVVGGRFLLRPSPPSPWDVTPTWMLLPKGRLVQQLPGLRTPRPPRPLRPLRPQETVAPLAQQLPGMRTPRPLRPKLHMKPHETGAPQDAVLLDDTVLHESDPMPALISTALHNLCSCASIKKSSAPNEM